MWLAPSSTFCKHTYETCKINMCVPSVAIGGMRPVFTYIWYMAPFPQTSNYQGLAKGSFWKGRDTANTTNSTSTGSSVLCLKCLWVCPNCYFSLCGVLVIVPLLFWKKNADQVRLEKPEGLLSNAMENYFSAAQVLTSSSFHAWQDKTRQDRTRRVLICSNYWFEYSHDPCTGWNDNESFLSRRWSSNYFRG